MTRSDCRYREFPQIELQDALGNTKMTGSPSCRAKGQSSLTDDTYSREQRLLDLIIAQDRNGLGAASASRAAASLNATIAQQGYARLVVATGSSQFEVLDALVSDTSIDWTKVDGFHLDEYLGLDISNPASFCGYLKKRFVDRVPLRSFHS